MNLVAKLLKADVSAQKVENKVEAQYLSRLLKEKTEVTVKAIDGKRYRDISNMAINTDEGKANIDIGKMQMGIILAGVVDPDLKSKELQEHFSAATPAELVDKMFLAGEQATLMSEIQRLSGFSENVNKDTKEIKN